MITARCRQMREGDRPAVQSLCERAQADYWGGIKVPIAWSWSIWEHVKGMYCIVAEAGGEALGVLIMGLMTHWEPPTAQIVGWATSPGLTRDERVAVGLRMLLYGYPACEQAGIARGWGEVEATNEIVLEVLERVNRFQIEAHGWEPSTTKEPKERRPHMYRVEVRIDQGYRDALKQLVAAGSA